MHRLRLLLALPLLFAGNIVRAEGDGGGYGPDDDRGRIVVANRASGTLSVIDVATDRVTTIDVPAAAQPAEPMYVNYSSLLDRFFVGDRANDRVVVYDADTLDVEGTVAAGRGVFHQWVGTTGHQLWVNNDVDNTTTVVDAVTLKRLAVVPTPADLVAQGGRPHDVFVDPSGRRAFVTVIGVNGPQDFVVQFSTRTFQETARAPVGNDPHLVTARRTPNLYVPAQGGNAVHVLDRRTLRPIRILSIPAAHGITIDGRAQTIYVTNIAGGGTDAVFTARLRGRRTQVVGSPESAPFPVPHNLWLSGDGGSLFLTHSGATADQVSIFEIPRRGATPRFVKTVSVGLNPFGLTFVP